MKADLVEAVVHDLTDGVSFVLVQLLGGHNGIALFERLEPNSVVLGIKGHGLMKKTVQVIRFEQIEEIEAINPDRILSILIDATHLSLNFSTPYPR